MAQGVGPEFKPQPQSPKNKNKKLLMAEDTKEKFRGKAV
jgi:hypothetical protein